MQPTRRQVLLTAAAVTLAGPTLAQTKLAEQARIYVSFAVGGVLDLIARVMAEALRGSIANNVIVENKSGASGRLAVDALRQMPADGLTMMINGDGIQTVLPHTFKQLNYQPFADIVPIGMTNRFEFAFAVGPKVPASVKTLKDYLAWVKGDADRAAFATPGAGTPLHFLPLLMGKDAGIDMVPVHYRGSIATFPDVMGGQIPAVSAPLPDVLNQLGSGKVRLLATSGAQRNKLTPDVATYAQQGWPQLTSEAFYALYVHGKTPPEVQEQLSAAVRKALAQPAVVAAFAKLYVEPAPTTPAEVLKAARSNSLLWAETVKAIGYAPE